MRTLTASFIAILLVVGTFGLVMSHHSSQTVDLSAGESVHITCDTELEGTISGNEWVAECVAPEPTATVEPTATSTPEPTATEPASTATNEFNAEYYNGENFDTFVREETVAYPLATFWGGGSPSGVNHESFTARYTGTFEFQSGTYNFYVKTDDGHRIIIDGTVVKDSFHQGAANIPYNVEVPMTAGVHEIVLEFIEFGGDASVQFNWSLTTPEPTATATPPTEPTATPQPSGTIPELKGVNLAGGEFGSAMPGIYGQDYIYPGSSDFQYHASKGVELARIPFRWERVQHSLGGPLVQAEIDRLTTVLDLAQQHGMVVMLDMHNYGRYNGVRIGDGVTNAQFADVWTKLATEFKDHPALFAYDLMNEPHDMPTRTTWDAAAQAAVDAIRTVDTATVISVEGDAWSGAHSWMDHSHDMHINDPSGLILYQAHQYFDSNSSGTYSNGYDATASTGVDRLQPFADWCDQHNYNCFIGEYNAPGNDSRWLTVLDNFVKEMDARGIGSTAWAGGPWWGDYPLSLNPNGDGSDRPQWQVLGPYMNN